MATLATVPLIGRHLTACTLTGQTVSAAGVLSAGTAYNILATVQHLQFSGQVEREEINGMNTKQRNEVVISDGFNATIEIFKVNGGTDPNVLYAAANLYDYFVVAWVEGTATGSIQTFTFTGVRGDFSTGMQGRGKQIAELQLGPVDLGPGNAQIGRVLS